MSCSGGGDGAEGPGTTPSDKPAQPGPSAGGPITDRVQATRDAEKSFSEFTQNLTAFADSACTWNSTTGAFTLAIPSGKVGSISMNAASQLTVNGAACPSTSTITASAVKTITVTGDNAGNETLVLDFLNGTFSLGSSTATHGIFVDLKGGTGDAVKVRMTNVTAEKVYCGSTTMGATACNINNQTSSDVITDIKTLTGVEALGFALGGGADEFYGTGVTGTANATLANPVALPLELSGGDDNDVLVGGAKADAFSGGDGVDTVSYATRTAALTITIDGTANDGDPTYSMGAGELDNVKADVETVTGGSGADTITGSANADTINGGAGDDIIAGGAGADTLNGDAGNDTFNEGTAANGSDTITGGAGSGDIVDYSARAAAIAVTIGAGADDGAVDADAMTMGNQSEADAVDVENVKGGDGADTITGDANANTITGGKGADTISGGAGDDIFVEGDQATATLSGADVIDGGDGMDSVTYFGRSAGITVTLNAGGAGDDGQTDADAMTMGNQSEGDDLTTMERVVGTDSDDTLTGSASNDNLEGKGGNDTLSGGTGDDQVEGDDGDDTVNCGGGNDLAIGGAGTNTINADCELTF
jgi:Ca2+-binding RTX toxin-like protein